MKYYAVLDTNVVVSALFNLSSVPGIILREALAGRVIPILHEDILEEYNDVLHRPKFRFDHRNYRDHAGGAYQARHLYGRDGRG